METKQIIVADDEFGWQLHHYLCIISAVSDNLQVFVDQAESGSELVDRVLAGDYTLVITNQFRKEPFWGFNAIREVRRAGKTLPIYVVCEDAWIVTDIALGQGATKIYDKKEVRKDSQQFFQDLSSCLKIVVPNECPPYLTFG